jgi:hypothetical protein
MSTPRPQANLASITECEVGMVNQFLREGYVYLGLYIERSEQQTDEDPPRTWIREHAVYIVGRPRS